MDFVGDYTKQKKLAEALRGQQKAMLGTKIDTGPFVTQASGAFPGQVDANPWGALGQVGMAYLAKQAGTEADTAEEAAQAKRREALAAITGGTPQAAQQVPVGGDVGPVQPGQAPMTPAGQMGEAPPNKEFEMTPDNMLQLNEMGIDSGLIQMMKPEKEKLANFLQAIPNMSPELAREMAARFKIDPAVAEKAITDYWTRQDKIKADDFAQRKELTLLGKPTPTPHEARQRDPLKELQASYVTKMAAGDTEGANKDLELYRTLKAAGGTGGGGAGNTRAAQAALSPAEMADTLTAARAIHKAHPEAWSGGQRALGAIGEAGGKLLDQGKVSGVPLKMIGSEFQNPHRQEFTQLMSKLALADISKLYPASDTDVKWIVDNLPNVNSNWEAADLMLQHLENVYRKAASGGFKDEKGNALEYTPGAAASGGGAAPVINPKTAAKYGL